MDWRVVSPCRQITYFLMVCKVLLHTFKKTESLCIVFFSIEKCVPSFLNEKAVLILSTLVSVKRLGFHGEAPTLPFPASVCSKWDPRQGSRVSVFLCGAHREWGDHQPSRQKSQLVSRLTLTAGNLVWVFGFQMGNVQGNSDAFLMGFCDTEDEILCEGVHHTWSMCAS